MLLNKSKIIGLLGCLIVFVLNAVSVFIILYIIRQVWNDPNDETPIKIVSTCALLIIGICVLMVGFFVGVGIVNYTIEIKDDLQEIERRTKSKKDDLLMDDP